MENEKRVIGLDFLKIIAYMGVVCLHAIGKESSEWNRMLYYLAGYAVPAFFMVHGFFILNRSKIECSYLATKAVRLILVALAWNCLFVVAQGIFGKEIDNPVIGTATELFMQKGIFFQFWFFGALILLYSLTPFLHRQIQRHNYRLLLILILLVTVIDVISMCYCWKNGIPLQQYIYQPFRLWSWLLYYYLGGVLKNVKPLKHIEKKKKIELLFCVGAISLAYEYFVGYRICGVMWAEYFYDNLLLIAEVALMFMIFSELQIENERIGKIITNASALTMGGYIVHPLVLKVIYHSYDNSNPLINVTIWIFAAGISLVIARVIKCIPYVRKLVEL